MNVWSAVAGVGVSSAPRADALPRRPAEPPADAMRSTVPDGSKFGTGWRVIGPWRPEPLIIIFGGVEGFRYEPKEES